MEINSTSFQIIKFTIIGFCVLLPFLALIYKPSIHSEQMSQEIKEFIVPKYLLPFKEIEYKKESVCHTGYKKRILGQFKTKSGVPTNLIKWREKTFCSLPFNRSEISFEDDLETCGKRNGSCWSEGVCFIGSCPVSDIELSNSNVLYTRGPQFISDIFILFDNRTFENSDLNTYND